MPDTMTDSFLVGQGIPVDLHDIEIELAKLWGPAAEQAGGPELQNPHVSRIALANLVVESLTGDHDSLRSVLETVIARFPCRAIVVRGSSDPAPRIAAEVSALCHLPAPGLPQVCSERIVLRAGPGAVDLVPGAVRPLLEAELPMVLWWTSDPRPHAALFRELAGECSRLILDLPDPGADPAAVRLGLDPAHCRYSRDVTWFGLTRWRELIAQFFDPPCASESPAHITAVNIEALSPDPARAPRIAIWLAAWLAGQLGWKPEVPFTRSLHAGGSVVQTALRGPLGLVTLEIVTAEVPPAMPPVPQLTSVQIEVKGQAGVETIRLGRPEPGSSTIKVEAETLDSCRLPRLVEAPELDPSRRIAAALESSRIDPPFQNALPIALWLLERGV
jgi:glucose-6-phosphate dehydrogenase assembly protein OpcA